MKTKTQIEVHVYNLKDRQCRYLDFIILSNGHRADIVFLPQLLGERGGHDFSSNVRRCIEVSFAVLAAV